MASSRCLLLVLFVVEIASRFSPSSSRDTSSVAAKPRSLSVKLIHRNSVSSPYYNPNASPWDLNRDTIAASIARSEYYSRRLILARKNNGYVVNQDGGAALVADYAGFVFLANISIGQPPVAQLVNVDTASDIMWIQCKPCLSCRKQAPVLFEPLKSSTYSNIPCNRSGSVRSCNDVEGKCDESKNHCIFESSYYDGTTVTGDFASEKLVLGTSDEGIITVPVEVFGCAHEFTVTGPSDNQASGVLGLGFGKLSLTYQLGTKFSLCFGNIHDPNYQYNKLIFGEGAYLDGPVTPIVSLNNGWYYVSLEGISVGQEKLHIDPNVFKLQISTGEGGTILDSGSTLTYMTKGGYDPLHVKVASILDQSLQRRKVRIGKNPMLCYKGDVGRDLKNFPAVSFHFAGGVDIVLGIQSMFYQVRPDILCMAVSPMNNGDTLTIMGVLAQQSYSIGYHITAMKAYILNIDCQDLES